MMLVRLQRASWAPIQQLNSDMTLPAENSTLTAIGLGATDTYGTVATDQLLKADLFVVGHEACRDIYGEQLTNGEFFCVGGKEGVGGCFGDSGEWCSAMILSMSTCRNYHKLF